MLARPDEGVDVARAALLIAGEEYPGLDVPRYLARLDEMGGAVRRRMDGAKGAVAALNAYLFEEEGFHGNEVDYYDPRNSFLNEVLDRRTGIPITLSTVYIEVAQRAGLAAAGVGLPGHFIVKVSAGRGDVLVDPYHQGRRLSAEDCQERLDRIYSGRLKVNAAMLAPCARKSILARMLRNLKAIYLKTGEQERALRILDLLLQVNPRSGEDVRDRGLLYAALDCYNLAARDLQAYVELFPRAPEAAELREQVAEYRGKAARVN
ncbi:MAG TPA: tetratricopeptide repeat protein [Vicinamibacteria bacterium]|nr:tetratricopeptide repeat protein [Vicinamibacteria bacterium]